ncbi:hypothetical protein [Phascolarctobacterium faecium]|nr:hypothetical protein [Phascolarctobacterium faecium]BBG62971.1 hypothetical protein PFJ30894_00594 [Phascolarctobacterium faecium]
MKRMNKVLAKAVVLILIMGGVHMGGLLFKKLCGCRQRVHYPE